MSARTSLLISLLMGALGALVRMISAREADLGTDAQSVVFRLRATLPPAAVAAATSAEQTFTMTGLAVDDMVLSILKPTAQAGIGIVQVRVSAADTIAITFMNATAAAVTPTASQVYEAIVLRGGHS